MKSIIIPTVLLSAHSSHAFQIAPSLRTKITTSPPILIPHHVSLQRRNILQESSPISVLYNSINDNIEDENGDMESTNTIELAKDTPENNHENALANLVNKLKQALSSHPPAAALFLSLFIFILPLLTAFPQSAMAVQSGGRLGGSFSGGSSRSSSSMSRSYSAPSRSYSRGYSSGGYGYSRPNVIVTPGISPFYNYSPFYSPFSRPYYGGPSVVAVNRGPSFFSLIFFAGFALFVASALSNIGSSATDTFTSAVGSNQSVLGPGVSTCEISVALEVPNRDSPNSILSALNRLSNTARTDSRVGLQNLTSQVAIELLRRKASIVAASTNASHYRDENKAQREFNNISIQQRGKFQRETVSKFGGVDYSDGGRNQPESSKYDKATVAVVTIVLLIDGDSTSKAFSRKVNSIRDVEDALSRLASDSKADNCLRGAEILWTPEERDDTLTMRDVFADYSSLRSI